MATDNAAKNDKKKERNVKNGGEESLIRVTATGTYRFTNLGTGLI